MTQQEFQSRYTYNPATDRIEKGGFSCVYKAYDTMRKRLNVRLALWLAFLLLSFQPLFSQSRIFAISVGVSEYLDPSANLTYSHVAAKEIYNLLLPHTTTDRIVLLTNENANLNNVVYQMKELFKQAKPEDVVIFYFAGHGYYNLFYVHDQNLYFSTLQEIFKECKANRKMIFGNTVICKAAYLLTSCSPVCEVKQIKTRTAISLP